MEMQLVDDDQGVNDGWTAYIIVKKFLGAISILLLFNQIFGEIRQLSSEGFKNYFSSAWNWVDILGLTTTLLFDIHTLAVLDEIPL